jgi:hypothetical protein
MGARAQRGVRRDGARPGTALLAVVAAAAVAPFAWTWNDPGAHVVGSCLALAVGLVLLEGRARQTRPRRDCAAALHRAVAVHVHLARARAVCATRCGEVTLVTFTWSGARTDLLDADGRVLHSVLHNLLEPGWTITVAVDDPAVAARIAADRTGGALEVYACVDPAHWPDGTVARDGVVRDEYALDLPSWRGTLTPAGATTPAGSLPRG